MFIANFLHNEDNLGLLERQWTDRQGKQRQKGIERERGRAATDFPCRLPLPPPRSHCWRFCAAPTTTKGTFNYDVHSEGGGGVICSDRLRDLDSDNEEGKGVSSKAHDSTDRLREC